MARTRVLVNAVIDAQQRNTALSTSTLADAGKRRQLLSILLRNRDLYEKLRGEIA